MSGPGNKHSRRAPLRFVWQMDAEHRFTVGSEEFAALMGHATAAALGRPWPELTAALALDPEGQVARALASHDTWSGLSIAWPVNDGTERLVVELSGLPVFDRERTLRGYRGFGVCRDIARLAALGGARPAATNGAAPASPVAENVVSLRPTGQPIAPALSPVERNAFHELTRKLHERLTGAGAGAPSGASDALRSSLAQAVQESQALQEAEAGQGLPVPHPIKLTAAEPGSALARAQAEIVELKSILDTAKHQAEMASAAKSEFLAKISDVVRAPHNAIIDFAEIMAQEGFGPIDERYRQRLGDIRGAGENLLALVDDLLDLSKIEANRLELDLAGVALNALTQQCVAALQPQANRERIIIRTSLSPRLPPVIADARTLRRMVLSLIAHSTAGAGAGGQVIVSTTLTDLGAVVLRVRDSGPGMSETEMALALEPFRQMTTATLPVPGGGLGLRLTKALAEANGAAFGIKSGPHTGTLIEVAFPAGRLSAEDRR